MYLTSAEISEKYVSSLLFPEYEIDLEPEELEDEPEKSDEQVLKEYEEILRCGQSKPLEDGKRLHC